MGLGGIRGGEERTDADLEIAYGLLETRPESRWSAQRVAEFADTMVSLVQTAEERGDHDAAEEARAAVTWAEERLAWLCRKRARDGGRCRWRTARVQHLRAPSRRAR